MKKNRKIPKRMSVMATNTMRFGAIIVLFFCMVILNYLSSSGCTQLMAIQGGKERELAKLEKDLERESSRWDEMKATEKLETALLRHGLSMRLPKSDQYVNMGANGMPVPGQRSLAKFGKARSEPARTSVSGTVRRKR